MNYVHPDHLGTPRAVTRASDNALVWRWDNAEPFGDSAANEDPSGRGVFAFNLRFPGQYFDGGRNYRLHLPPHIPAKDFWSMIVHDPQTRSMLQTDQRFPSVSSQKPDLVVNPDSSVDLYFGPEPPVGKETNWLQTIPGKGWYAGLRLYGPLAPWFDKSWRPGELEEIPGARTRDLEQEAVGTHA